MNEGPSSSDKIIRDFVLSCSSLSNRVVCKEVVGYIGITGNANPNVPHLHLSTKRNGAAINPETLLNAAVSKTKTRIVTPCDK